MNSKQNRGRTAYHAGVAAEDSVARHYTHAGLPVVARRWRGLSGEIDLVAQDGDGLVFIEVKKSRSHAQAATMLSPRQLQRICGAGTEFLDSQPKGQLTDIRFDLACVDNTGAVSIVENLSMMA